MQETKIENKWVQWVPSGISAKRRPLGLVAIYKTSGYFRIFETSFEELRGGPGFVDTKDLFKFITIYAQTPKDSKHPKFLCFKLWRKNPGEGGLKLRTEAPNGYSVGLRQVLENFGYGFKNQTCYFKVKYNAGEKMHYIEMGVPDFIYSPKRKFSLYKPADETG